MALQLPLDQVAAREFGLTNDRFKFVRQLQKGGQGEVHVCIRLKTGNEYAVKVINWNFLRRHPRNETMLRREIRTLRELQHPNIVNWHMAFWDEGDCYIVMDLAREGDLSSRIERGRGLEGGAANDAEMATRYVARQLLNGLMYMHARRVIHRDMKTENILIKSYRQTLDAFQLKLFDIKIADFGLSTWQDIENEQRTPVGTPAYVAPEILSGDYDERVDFFSFGVCIYIMLCGEFPFDRQRNALGEVPQINETYAWDQTSANAKLIVSGLLVVEPDERLHPGNALLRDWFAIDEKFLTRSFESELSFEGEQWGAIKRITGWSGYAVDTIKLQMRCGEDVSFGEDGGGFMEKEYVLKPQETVIAVAQETRILAPYYLGNAIVFYTSESTVAVFAGTDARNRNRFVAPPDSQIVGLQFKDHNLTGIYLEQNDTSGAVAQISGRTGSAVDHVELLLRNGTTRIYHASGGGWDVGPWPLQEDERIMVVEQAVREAHLGNSLTFYTSSGRVIKLAGMESSWSRRYAAPTGWQIQGLVFDGAVLSHVKLCPQNIACPRPHEIEQRPTEI